MTHSSPNGLQAPASEAVRSRQTDLLSGGSRIVSGRIASASLWLFRLGVLGSGIELFLLGHYEKAWQMVPVGLLAAALIISFLPVAAEGSTVRTVFTIVCIAMLISGPIGLLLHYLDNVEFEREMQPSISGVALFWKAIRGALPALAPGTMIYLGGLGLLHLRISQSSQATAVGRP